MIFPLPKIGAPNGIIKQQISYSKQAETLI